MRRLKTTRQVNTPRLTTRTSKPGRDWLALASELSRDLKSGAWKGHHSSPATWLSEVGKTVGYSPATLRRQIRIWEFLSQHLGKKSLSRLRTSKAPMATLEVLMRMNELVPIKAQKLLNKVIAGEISYRKLKAQYDEIIGSSSGRVNPRQIAPRRQSKFVESLVEYVQTHEEQFLFHKSREFVRNVRTRIRGFPYPLPELVATGTNEEGIEFVDGFDFRLITRNQSPSDLVKIVEAINLRAIFVTHYWVFIQEARNQKVAHALMEIEPSVLTPTIGIVSVRSDLKDKTISEESIEILQRPTWGGGRKKPTFYKSLVRQITLFPEKY